MPSRAIWSVRRAVIVGAAERDPPGPADAAGDRPQQRGLAGPVRAEHRGRAALGDGQVDAVQHLGRRRTRRAGRRPRAALIPAPRTDRQARAPAGRPSSLPARAASSRARSCPVAHAALPGRPRPRPGRAGSRRPSPRRPSGPHQHDDLVADRRDQAHVVLDQQHADPALRPQPPDHLARARAPPRAPGRRPARRAAAAAGAASSARASSTRFIAPYGRRRPAARPGRAMPSQLEGLPGLLGQLPLGPPRPRPAHRVAASRGGSRACPPSSTLASTVASGCSTGCWNVRATPEVGQPVRRRPQHVGAVEAGPSRPRAGKARDAVEQRGLAGPVRPDQAADLAGGDGEVDAVERAQPAEVQAQPTDVQQHGLRVLPRRRQPPFTCAQAPFWKWLR